MRVVAVALPARALVAVLLVPRRPSAVTRLVVPIVILAVDRVFGRRAEPHVGQEVLEGVQPPVADANAAATVVLERRVVGVGTTRLHFRPHLVLGRAPVVVATTTMLEIPLPHNIVLMASATESGSAAKVVAINGSACSAVATTQPECSGGLRVADVVQHQQPSESLPGQVLESRVSRLRMFGSHRLLLEEALGQWRSTVRAVGRHVSLYRHPASESTRKAA